MTHDIDRYYLMYLQHFLTYATFIYVHKPPSGYGVWANVIDF